MSLELQKHEPHQGLDRHAARDPLDMLQSMIERGVTTENAAAFEQLVKLSEHMEDRRAEKEFSAAFNALQSEMPKITAKKPVKCKDGTLKYKFAPFEEIMEQVRPLLLKHEFSVSFSMRFEAGRVIQSCKLHHTGGHTETNEFSVRIGSGPPGASETQADGAASTYAKRFALCNALNIIIEVDDDARAEGGPIEPAKAEDLKSRLRNVEGDEKAFLRFAGAESFDKISAVKLEMLEEFLAKKERIYMQKLQGKQ